EYSGHFQEICDIYLDCDMDAIVLKVKQIDGIACHTGRQSCFFYRLENNQWVE
ncbi:MAG: phosphoribosyl-AMP cyclohydrolase, partial [Gammaproteobacteria bacterium]|nr:phosphoribosyl-AMP cyclohydrolase [Gammaproteobacteria bacterium]NIO62994.1 phosphoribosyl-AMP cyclohydrolase [Gammaproteobacteria bacterium]NIT40023.1 phosphoribosyl-AMP cyclohydrolase [Gammaproteobacteria bacterium]